MHFTASAFTGVEFLTVTNMKQPDGSAYPKVPSVLVADPESVRIDPVSGNLVWTSEGDRSPTASPPRVIDPFIREMRADGSHVRDYALPAMFRMSANETGPRGNLAFEGLSFTPDQRRAVVIAEGPLYADGPGD